MLKIGLVLEGGGMRGMFTAGVLDFFLEKNLEFEKIIGVSAGACHACNFVSKQKYRSRDVTLNYINDKRYCSLYSLRTTGDLFGADFAYNVIPNELNLFDNEAYLKSKTKLIAVATDVNTGNPNYIHLKDLKKGDVEALRASASLPMVSNIVKYKNKEYLDGGLSDSIPLKKIESDGYEKNIVVLTREIGYRKRQSKSYIAMKRKYKNYPKVIERSKNRHLEYNESLDYLLEQEKAGKVFIIQPKKKLKVGRIEKNVSKLEDAYNDGYATAKSRYNELKKFMSKA